VGLYHFWGAIQKRDTDWVPESVFEFFEAGFFGVDIFFVLSGFVIMYSAAQTEATTQFASRFLLRRSIRIDPPYWFAIVIAIFLMFLKDRFYTASEVNFPSFTEIFAHIFYVQDLFGIQSISSVFWTLCLEFQFYIIFAFIYQFYYFAHDRFRFYISKFLAISAMGLCFLGPFFRFSSFDIGVPGTILPYSYEFIFGVLTYFYINGSINWRWLLSAMIISSIATTMYGPFYYNLVPILTVSVLIICTKSDIFSVLRSRIMLFFGKISYSFYLTHATVGWVSISIFIYLFEDFESGYITTAIFLSGIFVSVFFSVFFLYVIEIPSLKLSKRLKGGKI
jgi:peptidoglycan/LPS O-acetylase OafA/YrhL